MLWKKKEKEMGRIVEYGSVKGNEENIKKIRKGGREKLRDKW